MNGIGSANMIAWDMIVATACCAACCDAGSEGMLCIVDIGTASESGCVAGSVAEYDGDMLGRLASPVCCGVPGSGSSAVPTDGSKLPAPNDDWLPGPCRGLGMALG